jgi:hypothetical protein
MAKGRILKILANSALNDWYFVRSKDNPAEECTRTSPPKDFGPSCNRWIVGPSLLFDPK